MVRFIPRAIDTFDKFVDLSGNRPRQAENSQSHTNIQMRRWTTCTKLSSHFCPTIFYFFLNKIVATYVIEFLEDSSVFYNFQFGFSKSHSTSHAIITLVERVSKALDMGKYVVGVFFTLKRLFRYCRPYY